MGIALDEGTRIGGFELGGVIGRGAFGITYRARDVGSGEVYAIKEYMPEEFAVRDRTGSVASRAGHDGAYRRGLAAFLEEADILKNLPRRPGLVRVRGAFEKFGTAYCAMEFIEGDSLKKVVRRFRDRTGGRIPADLLSEFALKVLHALDDLHRARLIHRDVKPANVMIRRNGEPVLIDFGAARRLSRDGADAIFTRRYAAPEQFPPDLSALRRPLAEGPWTDLYSLSVMLYELIADVSPPDAMTRLSARLAGGPDPYEPLTQLPIEAGAAADYAPAFLAAIDRGCGLLPRERHRDARAFADALRPGAWSRSATVPSAPRSAPARAGPSMPLRVAFVVGLLTALLLGLQALSDMGVREEVF